MLWLIVANVIVCRSRNGGICTSCFSVQCWCLSASVQCEARECHVLTYCHSLVEFKREV